MKTTKNKIIYFLDVIYLGKEKFIKNHPFKYPSDAKGYLFFIYFFSVWFNIQTNQNK